MEIKIIYQDSGVLVCVKPAGVVSEDGGLPLLLRAQTGLEEIYCVHRLDRETAGLMVYAKTKETAAALSASIARQEMKKHYLCVVQGQPEERGEMRDFLYHDAHKNKSYVVRRMRRGVREAALSFETLQSYDGFCLLRVSLLTGRSHQIRVQFSSRGYPLLGDARYGGPFRDRSLALWSESLSFPSPHGGRPLRFSLPPPAQWPWTMFSAARINR